LTSVGGGRKRIRRFDFNFAKNESPSRGNHCARCKGTRFETGDVVVEIIKDYVDELLWKVVGSHNQWKVGWLAMMERETKNMST
jgi:hypothetical protein